MHEKEVPTLKGEKEKEKRMAFSSEIHVIGRWLTCSFSRFTNSGYPALEEIFLFLRITLLFLLSQWWISFLNSNQSSFDKKFVELFTKITSKLLPYSVSRFFRTYYWCLSLVFSFFLSQIFSWKFNSLLPFFHDMLSYFLYMV